MSDKEIAFSGKNAYYEASALLGQKRMLSDKITTLN